jgi:hypothetical protein
MKKLKNKQNYLQDQFDYWNLLRGRNIENKAFKNRCEIFCNAVEADLNEVNKLNDFVENGFRS